MAKITIQDSVLQQAKNGDKDAIMNMFHNFISEDEVIVSVEYLGAYGVFFTTKSFVCITDKRVAALEYGPFGKILYSDAYIEEVNSGVIYQPSVLKLYFVGVVLCLTIVGILLLNGWVRLFYKFNKSGMVWCVREGVNIYAFANRSRINLINDLWRTSSFYRGQRKQYLR